MDSPEKKIPGTPFHYVPGKEQTGPESKIRPRLPHRAMQVQSRPG